ncbi:hypothetical protein U1Q18_015001, partial [Sarracenia purpurea var. burkii]
SVVMIEPGRLRPSDPESGANDLTDQRSDDQVSRVLTASADQRSRPWIRTSKVHAPTVPTLNPTWGSYSKSTDSDEVSENPKQACSQSPPTKGRNGYRDRPMGKRIRTYKMGFPLGLSDLEAGSKEDGTYHALLCA